jgi:hypothetical protein
LKLKKKKRSNFSFSVVIIAWLAGWLDPHTIFYLYFCVVQITELGIAETYIIFQETLCTTLMIPQPER